MGMTKATSGFPLCISNIWFFFLFFANDIMEMDDHIREHGETDKAIWLA